VKTSPSSEAPSPLATGLFANGFANSRVVVGPDGLGKDVRREGLGAADHVGVHAKRDRWVGMAEAGGDYFLYGFKGAPSARRA
jgi:hypothetical protein